MITETLISLLTAVLLFTGLMKITYYALAKEYVRFVGQEALYCMLEIDNARECEHEAQSRLSRALQMSGDPWIQLSGEGHKRKIARTTFRTVPNAREKDELKQTLTLKGVLHASKRL